MNRKITIVMDIDTTLQLREQNRRIRAALEELFFWSHVASILNEPKEEKNDSRKALHS